MRKSSIFITILFLFNFLLCPLLASDNTISYNYLKSIQHSSAMNLDDGWKFILSDNKDFSKPDFDDSAWEDINLPDDWAFRNGFAEDNAQQARGGFAIGGIGWYRNKFNLTARQLKNKMYYIHFDAVYMNSEVWINGHYLGKRPYGYISFDYDLTPYLNEGSNNISVRVDNSMARSARWYHGCGIYGNVSVYAKNTFHFSNNSVFIRTSGVSAEKADVKISWEVNDVNDNSSVSYVIFDAKGKRVVSKKDIKFNSEKGKTSFSIANPQLWDIDTPNLYTLSITLKRNGKKCDSETIRFGVRDIKWKAKSGFWLNGRNIKLRGMCEHLEGGPVGAAWTENLLRWKIEQIKASGANAIRTAHNPQLPMFYDLCDEMGVLVLDESFDGWCQKADQDYGFQAFNKWALKDLSDFIKRDRNHACVIAWSVGNETQGEIAKDLVNVCHREDETRLVTSGASGSDAMDIYGVNGGSEHKSFMEEFIPSRPFLGTEYPHNCWCRGIYHSTTDYKKAKEDIYETPDFTKKEIFQYTGARMVDGKYKKLFLFSSYDNTVFRQNVRQSLALLRDKPWFSGYFRWVGFDYYGEVKEWPYRGSQSGIMDFAGLRKDAFYLYQSEWTNKPMVHILPHWTHPMMKEGTKVPVFVYTTGDNVELFLNGKSLGMKKKGKAWNELAPKWMVAYKPGKLKAVAYKNGKVYASEEIMTSKEPFKLSINTENSYLTGSPKDLQVVTIKELDSSNTFYPYGENRIYYHLTGGAEIFSSESGSYYDSDICYHATSRKCFFGMQRLFIRNYQQKKFTLYSGAILGDKLLQTGNKVSIDVQKLTFKKKIKSSIEGKSCIDDCEVYYTIDGSKPSTSSLIYSKPFEITLGTVVKAVVYKDGNLLFEMEENFAKNAGIYWGEPLPKKNITTPIKVTTLKLTNCEVIRKRDENHLLTESVVPNSGTASFYMYKENDDGEYKSGIKLVYNYVGEGDFTINLYNNNELVDSKRIIKKDDFTNYSSHAKFLSLPLKRGANRVKVEIISQGNVALYTVNFTK